MKGKRYTTEEKIRILREADSGKVIKEVRHEHNLSEVSSDTRAESGAADCTKEDTWECLRDNVLGATMAHHSIHELFVYGIRLSFHT